MVLGTSGLAFAGQAMYSGNGFNDPNHGLTMGVELIPNEDIRVTMLGMYDGGADGAGLQTSRDVGLWASDGTLLASATVMDADPVTNNFHYVAITPVVLTKGQTYILGGYFGINESGDKLIATALTPAPFVTLPGGVWEIGGTGLTFPYGATHDTEFRVAANLMYEPVDTSPFNISGTVTSSTSGADICALVLASGIYTFSCSPNGIFSLSNLYRRPDGTAVLQLYASGFLPWKTTLTGPGTTDAVMTKVGSCPDYNSPSSPGVYPGSAGQYVDIDGQVLVQNSSTPVCAIVLAGGQFMFSCGGSGNYNLHIPLDSNGQYKLQVYADGFAPYIVQKDMTQLTNTIRLAKASECS